MEKTWSHTATHASFKTIQTLAYSNWSGATGRMGTSGKGGVPHKYTYYASALEIHKAQ